MTRVVLVGDDVRADAWHGALRHSTRLTLAERVPGDDATRLEAALAAHPDAHVAVACAPREASRVARRLARSSRSGLVRAPVFEPARFDAPTLQVDHGWVTLPSARWLAGLRRRAAFRHLSLTVAGLPDASEAALDEVLWHALAWIRRVDPRAELRSATLTSDDEATLELEGSHALSVTLRAAATGQRFEAQLDGDELAAHTVWQPGSESRTLRDARSGRSRHRVVDVATPAERALGQLLSATGDDWRAAVEVAAWVHRAQAMFPRRLPPGSARFVLAARRSRERPDAVLRSIGLLGPLPDVALGGSLDVTMPPEPLEVIAFRAGLKPVLLLTLPQGHADRAVGWLPGAHVELRPRRVAVGCQDAYDDRRDVGEPMVELFASRDPALAKRAAHLHAEVDPSQSLSELGELMGYPPCCVSAFGAQRDRSNNTRNRYCTAARTLTDGPWPWELNDVWIKVVPFFACSYACPRALHVARATLTAAEASRPGLGARLAAALAAPVLYFVDGQALSLDLDASPGRSALRSVRILPGAARDVRRLAAAIAEGDAFEWSEAALVVWQEARERWRFERTDPALGLLLPFGAATGSAMPST